MAEHGPPRNGIILFFVILSVGTLASLKPAFDAYYDTMFTSAVQDRLETYSDLGDVQAAEAALVGPMREIDRSIASFADSRPSSLRPEHPEEMNLDPLRGWNQLPQELPVRPEPEPEVLDEVSPEALDLLEELPTEDVPVPTEAPTPAPRRPRPAPPTEDAPPTAPAPVAPAPDAPTGAPEE